MAKYELRSIGEAPNWNVLLYEKIVNLLEMIFENFACMWNYKVYNNYGCIHRWLRTIFQLQLSHFSQSNFKNYAEWLRKYEQYILESQIYKRGHEDRSIVCQLINVVESIIRNMWLVEVLNAKVSELFHIPWKLYYNMFWAETNWSNCSYIHNICYIWLT